VLDRVALTSVAIVLDQANNRKSLAQVAHDLARPIAAAIVHDE